MKNELYVHYIDGGWYEVNDGKSYNRNNCDKIQGKDNLIKFFKANNAKLMKLHDDSGQMYLTTLRDIFWAINGKGSKIIC